MTIKEWIAGLDRAGSTDDPIRYQGVETTPLCLSYEFSPLTSIKNLRIEYHGAKKRWVNGTAGGMLRDRQMPR